MSESDQKLKQPTKHWPQYLAGASAASGGFILGTILGIYFCKKIFLKKLLKYFKGWSSPTGRRVREEYNLSAIQWDWVGSMMTIGASISCLPIGLQF